MTDANREWKLPHVAQEAFDSIQSEKVLGASRQIRLVGELLVAIAQEHEGSKTELADTVANVVAEVVKARGDSSQAIPNAIAVMLQGIGDQQERDVEELRASIIASVSGYLAEQHQWMELIASCGRSLLSGVSSLVLFDYSSSVSTIVKELSASIGRNLELNVLEARPLSGGSKYLIDELGLKDLIRFLPDAAMLEAVRGADAVLVGAETITVEGGCYNTVGSELAALVASQESVPFYVATTTIKVDVRTFGSPTRPVPSRDLRSVLSAGWPPTTPTNDVDFICPDLDYVPPGHVTGFVTEQGLLLPTEVRPVAAKLANATEGAGGT